MTGQIKIEGTVYPLKFGYGAIKRLGLMWGVEFGEVFERFNVAFAGMEKELKFEYVDIIGEMILAGILNANDTADVNSDDIVNDIVFGERVDEITNVAKLFFDSMPKDLKQTQPAKKKAAKTSKTKKKKA